jgi:hypothetical protein
VLALVAEGLTNAAIAGSLVVGGGAVEKHINNIFTKLGLELGERHHRPPGLTFPLTGGTRGLGAAVVRRLATSHTSAAPHSRRTTTYAVPMRVRFTAVFAEKRTRTPRPPASWEPRG